MMGSPELSADEIEVWPLGLEPATLRELRDKIFGDLTPFTPFPGGSWLRAGSSPRIVLHLGPVHERFAVDTGRRRALVASLYRSASGSSVSLAVPAERSCGPDIMPGMMNLTSTSDGLDMLITAGDRAWCSKSFTAQECRAVADSLWERSIAAVSMTPRPRVGARRPVTVMLYAPRESAADPEFLWDHWFLGPRRAIPACGDALPLPFGIFSRWPDREHPLVGLPSARLKFHAPDGRPVSSEDWERLAREERVRVVGRDHTPAGLISTVWTGLRSGEILSWAGSRPFIYQTALCEPQPNGDVLVTLLDLQRTREEAALGHQIAVSRASADERLTSPRAYG